MKIQNQLQKHSFDKKINFRHYRSGNNTDVVIFCHGIGERGLADGSEIALVERNNGWPKFAKGIRPGETVSRGNIEYPFDIMALQVSKEYNNYQEFFYHILPWATLYYGYKNVVLAGISMGCFGIYDMLKYDLGKNVKGVVACCGGADLSEIQYMVKVPGIAWHGDIDDSPAKYPAHKSFVEAYNAAGGAIEFITLPGVKHNAWDYAFNADQAKDRSLAFANKIFEANRVVAAPAPTTQVDPIVEYNKGIAAAVAAVSALKK